MRTLAGMGVHAWENIMVSSLALAAGVAVIVGVSTWAVVQLQRAELQAADAEMDLYKQESNERVAESSKQIARLSAEAETARKETVQAQLQLEMLRRPRMVDSSKLQHALNELEPAAVEILFDRNAPDASYLAGVIWNAFKNASWRMLQSSGPEPLREPPRDGTLWYKYPWTQAAGGSLSGLSVVTTETADPDNNYVGYALVEALRDAINDPQQQTTLGTPNAFPLAHGAVRIIVGPKLP